MPPKLAEGWTTAASMLSGHDRIPPALPSATPTVNSIPLISTHTLADRFRTVFTYPLLNAVQSKCFPHVYNSDDNFVLSSPTGSGKTVIFELAICRLVNTCMDGTYKIIYQAPTKSLCAERYRDWQTKFAALNLQVAELTGDVQNAQLKSVQHADIIVTTPEKWDSITRKWKDHKKLMHMVRLFLIDEVHTLKEDRGAVLEVVVSRMKSVGADVRFIALSATIPNIDDISKWLGRNQYQEGPALQEVFGEEYRPVRIVKHVLGFASKGNEFAFDKSLSAKIPDIITRYAEDKPVMIFCFTRASCLETAKHLAERSNAAGQQTSCDNADLQATIRAGIAFHHAGLSLADRATVEQGYLAGTIRIICCTSTLAAGVNLPCHMVIIKNTVAYAHDSSTGCKEYPDLEVVQMLGRAGRPQFGQSAVAVIMTRQHKVDYYERLVSGKETIESRLHLNLIDHLNAEIGLGTVHDDTSATTWLRSTFLYIRLQQNPHHYKLSIARASKDLHDHIALICNNGIALLQKHGLITKGPALQATAYGDAMSRYCVQFETMQLFTALPSAAKMSEILTAISQAAEFKDIYFRSGEKAVYRQWDNNALIKFPLKVYVDIRWHKVSLTIQAVLAGGELLETHREMRQDFGLAKNHIFQHSARLLRCICDCMIYEQDSIGLRSALTLSRSLAAQIWDDSTLHMSQLEGLGMASARKLVKAGIRTIEDLAHTEHHQLERLLSRHPPFGTQLRQKAELFPRLGLDIELKSEPRKATEHVEIDLNVRVKLLNASPTATYNQKAISVCLLVESSTGLLLHVNRSPAAQLIASPNKSIKVRLVEFAEAIHVQVACEDYAGTAVAKTIRTGIHRNDFAIHTAVALPRTRSASESVDYGDLNDADLLQAETQVVDLTTIPQQCERAPIVRPVMLNNRKWACRHTCKDKTKCKHLCCREGLDKKPKALKPAEPDSESRRGLQQSQLKLSRVSDGSFGQAATCRTIPPTEVPQVAQPTLKTVRETSSTERDTIQHSSDTSTIVVNTDMDNSYAALSALPPISDNNSCEEPAATHVDHGRRTTTPPVQSTSDSTYEDALRIVRALLGDEHFTYVRTLT